jgi:hypothetical protein
MKRKPQPLSQYMTPSWAAHELWRGRMSDLEPGSLVLEPTCGDGRMLQAVPPSMRALGVEVDPILAGQARERTGREVLVGDILHMGLPENVDAVFGNPPFKSAFINAMLMRFAETYADGIRCGLILPAYILQTPSSVIRWNQSWTIGTELLPRTLFPDLSLPLVFATFTKDPVPSLNGMRLYIEAAAISKLPILYRNMLANGRGLWVQVVEHALVELGGKAHLNDIYHMVGGRRPTTNPYWREKVRQTLQRGPFVGHGAGVWEKAAA